jgi:hypothetical protein
MTAPGQVEAEATRKVKAAGSHAESPERQMQKLMEDAAKVPVGGGNVSDASSVEEMFKLMMKKMDNVETKVDNMDMKVDGMATKVEGAVQAANEAKEGVKQVEEKMEIERKNRETWQAGMEERFTAIEFAEPAEEARPVDPVIQSKLTDIENQLAKMSTSDPWAAWKGKTSHNPSGPVGDTKWKDDEKRNRTVTFGPFPEDTKAAIIVSFIDGKMADVKPDIEEIFAFGKTRAERGGARFKTREAMWKYMVANAGNHRHIFKEKSVYANVDNKLKGSSADEAKVKAMRKVVRIVIEKNGADGKEVKKHMETRYGKGRVLWKDELIAAWDEKKEEMILHGWAKQHEQEFIQLMKPTRGE